MNVHDLIGLMVHAELPDRLQKRQRFNVTHRPADFHQHNIHIIRNPGNAMLDLIRHMGNHLNRLPQIISTALFGQNRIVDLSGSLVMPACGMG